MAESKGKPKDKEPAKPGATGETASRLIDQRVRDLEGWRGETLAHMRTLIREARGTTLRGGRAMRTSGGVAAGTAGK